MSQSVAITHVNVVPMDSERILEDQTLVIDGNIVALDRSQNFASLVAGTQEIDGRGKFVMPGLADMHVHFWDSGQAALFLANGVTLVRNMSGAALHLAVQQKLVRRELVGPRVVTTTPLGDGINADGKTVWPGSTVVTDPDQAAGVVKRFAEPATPN